MDRPERQEPPSIFSRPDPELEDVARRQPAGADAPRSMPPEPDPTDVSTWGPPSGPSGPSGPRYPRRPMADERGRRGPSSTALIALVGGVLLVGLAGFIGLSVLGSGDGDSASTITSPGASVGAGAAASLEPSASASLAPSPSPSPTPREPARPLTAGAWATVREAVNVRQQPSLSAEAVGQAAAGELVFVLDEAPVDADGLSWYRTVASPGVAGWIAAHAEYDQFVASDAPTTSVPWCAVPDGAVFASDGGGGHGAPVEAQLLDTAHLGGLPVPTGLLGEGGGAFVELAWGTQDEVCLDLAIVGGRTSSVGLSTSIEGCGRPWYGASVMAVFGTGAVGTDGTADSRTALVHRVILGYDPATSGLGPNMADVIMMAASGGTGTAANEVCFTGSASGPATSLSREMSAATTQCAWVSRRTDSAVTLTHPEGWWDAELRLTEGSFVGEGVTQQSSARGQRGFRVSAKAGIDGSVGISPRTLPDCEAG